MPLVESADRREYIRLTIPLPARFRLRGSPVVRRGTMTNISEAGAALLTPVPLPRNSVVDPLRFSFPSDTNDSVKVSVTAGVVKTEKQRFADSTERYRSGLVFLDLTGEPLKKVSKLIDRSLGQSGRGLPR